MHAAQDFLHSDSAPVVIETAPTGDTVEIAGGLDFRQLIEFCPRQF
jgi:hypothetical protein